MLKQILLGGLLGGITLFMCGFITWFIAGLAPGTLI